MTPETYRDARVLVTGASGFIGRNLIPRLLVEGARVTGLTRDRGLEVAGLPRGVGFVAADVADEASVHAALADRPFDVVFHLAADTDNSRNPKDPARILRTNALGTLNVLRALEPSGYRMAVIASTAELYGDGPPPSREDARRLPLTVYSASKATAEDFALAYQRSKGWPVSVARIFQPYGPGQKGRFVVASILEALLDEKPLDLTAGEQTRDFVYVGDVAEALLAIGARPALAGRVLNVGSGVETRIRDLAALATSLLPEASPGVLRVGALPYRSSEVMRQRADVTELSDALGAAPRTSLEWGLRLTIEAARRERDVERRRATGS